jgi:hypothetical protein
VWCGVVVVTTALARCQLRTAYEAHEGVAKGARYLPVAAAVTAVAAGRWWWCWLERKKKSSAGEEQEILIPKPTREHRSKNKQNICTENRLPKI